ncbi:hypothetical protein HDU85_005790 [Gaertneriomyces sp. JEL0708]|nr:hypothetical protein HDU85_005790 [Gaertneriomyces sp. JEL0708]
MPGKEFNLADHLHAVKLNSPKEDYDVLMDAIGDAQVVCIGDGSHGTLEFYRERAFITQRLITEKQFNAVIVEADWPDSVRINRYVTDTSQQPIHGALDALADFKRFPLWMWRNEVLLPFIKWLRLHNDQISARGGNLFDKVHFYGMDLYSLHTSTAAVISYLESVDPAAARKARHAYGCIHEHPDPSQYAFAVRYGVSEGCEEEVLKVLKDLIAKRMEYVKEGCKTAEERQFVAEMNAWSVMGAEEYYRRMLEAGEVTWNLRDEYMVDTISRVMKYLSRHRGGSSEDKDTKVVVWAHNSHLGDARATDMGQRRGEVNVGQLLREKIGDHRVFNVGFGCHDGTVMAAHDWDTPGVVMKVKPSLSDSHENLFHSLTTASHRRNALLLTHRIQHDRKVPLLPSASPLRRLQRFIGVIYRPSTERWSHYSESDLLAQFDAYVFVGKGTAVRPLDRGKSGVEPGEEVPETFPEGL